MSDAYTIYMLEELNGTIASLNQVAQDLSSSVDDFKRETRNKFAQLDSDLDTKISQKVDEAIAAAGGGAAKTLINTPKPGVIRYNGNPQETDITSNVYYTVSGTTEGTDVGTYEITLMLTNPDLYAWADGSPAERTLYWSISKGRIKKPTINEEIELRYNGQQQTVSINDLNDKIQFVIGTDPITQIEVGNYESHFSLIDINNYEWEEDGTVSELVLRWSIKKGTSSYTTSPAVIRLNEKNVAQEIVVTTESEGEISIVVPPDSAYCTAQVEGKHIIVNASDAHKAGKVTMQVAVEGDAHYTSTTFTLEIDCRFVELVEFTDSSASINQLQAMLNGHYQGDLDITEYWDIGDQRDGTPTNGFNFPGDDEEEPNLPNEEGTSWTIIGLNHDDLVEPINGITKAAITIFISGCVGNSDSAITLPMDNVETPSEWETCFRRRMLNGNYFNNLPFKNLIKTVRKPNAISIEADGIVYTEDKCFLLSEWEYFGDIFNARQQEGNQYPYFQASSNWVRPGGYSAIGEPVCLWLRSKYAESDASYVRVKEDGTSGAHPGTTTDSEAIAFACCL